MSSFKLVVDNYFKLSTGMIALAGKIEPSDFPIVTSEKYMIEIKSVKGKKKRLEDINEDIFSGARKNRDYSLRSFQTSENIDEFIDNIDEDPIFLQGSLRE